MANIKLSQDDIGLIIELSLAGHSRKEIADKFDVSPQTVCKHVLKFIDTYATDEEKKRLTVRPRGGRIGKFKNIIAELSQSKREAGLMQLSYEYGYRSGQVRSQK